MSSPSLLLDRFKGSPLVSPILPRTNYRFKRDEFKCSLSTALFLTLHTPPPPSFSSVLIMQILVSTAFLPHPLPFYFFPLWSVINHFPLCHNTSID